MRRLLRAQALPRRSHAHAWIALAAGVGLVSATASERIDEPVEPGVGVLVAKIEPEPAGKPLGFLSRAESLIGVTVQRGEHIEPFVVLGKAVDVTRQSPQPPSTPPVAVVLRVLLGVSDRASAPVHRDSRPAADDSQRSRYPPSLLRPQSLYAGDKRDTRSA